MACAESFQNPGEIRKLRAMDEFPARSPGTKLRGIVYLGRMIDKIRAHASGKLPADYQANLGKGFDANCTVFLGVNYGALATRVRQGGTDDEIAQWCFDRGREPTADEIDVWNEYMRKRGWNDDVTEVLERRKREAGMIDRPEVNTMFAFIDADEGRPVPRGSDVASRSS